jgi:formylglycine-generating enzyme required for sulfatase activity
MARAQRGASFAHDEERQLRLTRRMYAPPDEVAVNVGFRVARDTR